ncbi:MAG: MBL fold metallo-hydrolase [Bacteroidales bacterium]|nr:MBL fold metallo-hydrolase [Bacteroidales bacterium]
MKITFLGTGTSQGVPVIACDCRVCRSADHRDRRLRTALLVENNDFKIAIDAGPDFRQQMLAHGVKRLDAILLTHEHKDHIGGIDDVRAFNFRTRKAVDIYCDERVRETIIREYPYVFAVDKYPGAPSMNLNTIDSNTFSVGSIDIMPVEVSHFWLPVFGFRIGEMAYITDAKSVSPESMEKLAGVRYLIINALRREAHISHLNLDEAVAIIEQISPEQAFLTHVGHQMGLFSEVEKILPRGVSLAYDGLTFECE